LSPLRLLERTSLNYTSRGARIRADKVGNYDGGAEDLKQALNIHPQVASFTNLLHVLWVNDTLHGILDNLTESARFKDIGAIASKSRIGAVRSYAKEAGGDFEPKPH